MTDARRDTIWQQDAVAGRYRESVRGAIPFAGEQLAVMLQLVASAGRPVRRFLDIGAGDGLLSAALLSRYPAAAPVLVDFSPSMLEAAADRLAPLTDAARLLSADLATPDWRGQIAPLAPFDAIVSGFAIHHLTHERKRALYGELFALLAPGGAFAHIEHVAPEADWVRQAYDAGVIDALLDFASRRGKTPPSGGGGLGGETPPSGRGGLGGETASRDEIAATYFARPDRMANILAPLETQCDWLRQVGFTDVVAPFRWYELAVFGGRRPLT